MKGAGVRSWPHVCKLLPCVHSHGWPKPYMYIRYIHIKIRCIYGIVGRKITEYTVMYGVNIRFWPTLLHNKISNPDYIIKSATLAVSPNLRFEGIQCYNMCRALPSTFALHVCVCVRVCVCLCV